MVGCLYPRALPPVTHSSALQAPERLWSLIRGRTIPRTGVYPCLSPCDGCKDPKGVMVGLTENIQACLRIFRRAQHLWLVRDILHLPQGVFMVFVLLPVSTSRFVLSVISVKIRVERRIISPLAYCPPGRGLVVCYLHRGRCPRLLMVVPSRHRSACGV